MNPFWRRILSVVSIVGIFLLVGAPRASAQTFDMREYWLMDQGTYMKLYTVFKNGSIDPEATHAFWRGSFLGKTVALQGGIAFNDDRAAYDIFEIASNNIKYWGSFRGNSLQSQSQKSNAFNQAIVFMPNFMSLKQSTSETVFDNEMANNHRKISQSDTYTYRLTVDDYLSSWLDTDSGNIWKDVLKIRIDFPSGYELYWLARRLLINGIEYTKHYGTVRFESYCPDHSNVSKQYATPNTYTGDGNYPLYSYSPPAPIIPWYDPFSLWTYVPNGFFEDHLKTPVNGGWPLKNYERSWTGYSPPGNPNLEDVAVSNEKPNSQTSTWKVVLRKLPTTGWDYAISDSIPVIPNKTYRLSGWI